jgi:hypothetical protein
MLLSCLSKCTQMIQWSFTIEAERKIKTKGRKDLNGMKSKWDSKNTCQIGKDNLLVNVNLVKPMEWREF